MDKLTSRKYFVKENAPVYFTYDMEKTTKWFENVMGWFSEIDERNKKGQGLYGCVYSIPKNDQLSNISPFTGIHLFYGKPSSNMISFMCVEGIDEMRSYIIKNGWDKVTEIKKEPWGGRTLVITTIDGSKIYCFE